MDYLVPISSRIGSIEIPSLVSPWLVPNPYAGIIRFRSNGSSWDLTHELSAKKSGSPRNMGKFREL